MVMIQTFPTGSGSSSGGSITILGCFNTAPTSFVQGDIYYNTTDGLIYTSADGTTWGTGTTPKEDVLYISLDDHKIYSYTNNAFEIYGGNVEISKEPFNTLSEKSDGLYAEPKGLGAAYRKDTTLYEGSIKTKGNYPISDDITNYDALEFTIKWYSESNPNTTQQTIKVNDILGKAVNAIMLTLPVYDSDISYIGCNFASATNVLSVNAVVIPSSDRAGKWQGITKIVGVKYTTDVSQLVDSSKAIEDTPVGTLISKTGTLTPSHYLQCDGTIYNILDYPDLAQHFKDEYGCVNAFGGDGVTTFAVPDYSPEKQLNTSSIASSAWASSIYSSNYAASKAFNGAINTQSNYWQSVEPATFPVEIGIDLGSEYYVTRYALQNLGWNSPATYDRPNTWDFEGSNDKTNWNIIDTVTNYTWTSNTPEFKVKAPGNYRYYRLMIKACVGTGVSGVKIAPILNQILLYYSDSIYTHIKAEPTYYMELNQDAYINQYCNIYSTDEKIVGKWTNGKPIYRKILTYTNTSLLSNTTVDIPHNVANFDSVVNVSGFSKATTGEYFTWPVGTAGASAGTICIGKVDSTNLQLRLGGQNLGAGAVSTIIFEYTKTTDVENSFDYGMIIDQFAQEALLDVAVTDAEVDRCFE